MDEEEEYVQEYIRKIAALELDLSAKILEIDELKAYIKNIERWRAHIKTSERWKTKDDHRNQ